MKRGCVRKLWWVCWIACMALLTACARDEGRLQDIVSDSRDGRIVRVAMRRLPPAMADIAAHSGQPSIDIWPAFFDGLTFLDADGRTQPWLATEWVLVDDTTWRFRLRKGVRFSNGEPFDAHAVQTSVDNVLFGYGAGNLVRHSLLPTVSGARVIDDHTIEITTYSPDPLLPRRLAQFYPLPPKYFAEVGPRGFARAPVGTGPFMVTSWEVGIVRTRVNPHAWNPPRVDGVDFVEIPDITARRQAIESRQVHLAQYLAPDDVRDLEPLGIRTIQAPEPRIRLIVFIVREGSPLRSVLVRRALNHAVNREAIVKYLLAGAPVATQVGIRAMEGFDTSLEPFAYDPARARELLAQAGYPDGLSLTMEVLATTNTDRLVFEAVAADLAEAGVKVELRTVEFERWRANLLSGNWKGDMYTWSAAIGPLFDISRIWEYMSCDRPRPPFCQPEISRLIEARTSEMDPVRRAELMARANALLQEDPPAILLHELTAVHGLRGIDNYEVHNLVVRWDRLEMDESETRGGRR
jgi:peptide/nickel transport system substrate-binding protein